MKNYTSYFAKLNKILDAGYLPISIARRVWEVFEQISEINGKKDLVLLCFEKSGEFYHRNIFASLMGEKTANRIEELNI